MNNYKSNQGNHLSHAYIISSVSEETRKTTAKQLAMSLVCSSDGSKIPCGLCRDCQKAINNNHPDIIFIRRMIDDNGNPKKEIYVEQIRYMVSDSIIAPNEAKRKVYIVEDAETMNESAQNAALKLLEEPPQTATFILCTSNSAALLPTVRSRCFELNSNDVADEEDNDLKNLSKEFLEVVSSKKPEKIISWCSKYEDMDTARAKAFVKSTRELLIEILGINKTETDLSRIQIMKLIKLMEKCSNCLSVNTGVKHVFGLIMVDAIGCGKENND